MKNRFCMVFERSQFFTHCIVENTIALLIEILKVTVTNLYKFRKVLKVTILQVL